MKSKTVRRKGAPPKTRKTVRGGIVRGRPDVIETPLMKVTYVGENWTGHEPRKVIKRKYLTIVRNLKARPGLIKGIYTDFSLEKYVKPLRQEHCVNIFTAPYFYFSEIVKKVFKTEKPLSKNEGILVGSIGYLGERVLKNAVVFRPSVEVVTVREEYFYLDPT